MTVAELKKELGRFRESDQVLIAVRRPDGSIIVVRDELMYVRTRLKDDRPVIAVNTKIDNFTVCLEEGIY